MGTGLPTEALRSLPPASWSIPSPRTQKGRGGGDEGQEAGLAYC